MKNNRKLLKFFIFIALIIPIAFCATGVVQTLKLNSINAEIANTKNLINEINNECKESNNEYDYKTSDQYLEDYFKNEKNLSKNNDIFYEINNKDA